MKEEKRVMKTSQSTMLAFEKVSTQNFDVWSVSAEDALEFFFIIVYLFIMEIV